jgi:hypothetical protein
MAIVNITVENDADFYRQFAYQLVDGTPINLTGLAMVMGIRRLATDVTEELQLTTQPGGGLVIVDPPNGVFTVQLTQDQLVHLPLGDFEHSLILLSGAAKYRMWSGARTINPGASR